jgi:hypothetical protein
MKDLKSAAAIWIKGGLFLLIAIASSVLLALELRTPKGCLLLALCVWAFCRAYHFAFYVVEHYVDPGYKFSGLISFCQYIPRKGSRD